MRKPFWFIISYFIVFTLSKLSLKQLLFLLLLGHTGPTKFQRVDWSLSVMRAFTGYKTRPRNGCRLTFRDWGGIRLNSRIFLQNTSRILTKFVSSPECFDKTKMVHRKQPSHRKTKIANTSYLPRLNTFHIPPFHQISWALFHHKQTRMQHILAEYLPERLAQTIDL